MEGLSSALTVLTAMITPAMLISACGTMILSTSTRVGRVVDRVRSLSDRLEDLAKIEGEVELLEERRAIIFAQLDKLTSRARILQCSLTIFYEALCVSRLYERGHTSYISGSTSKMLRYSAGVSSLQEKGPILCRLIELVAARAVDQIPWLYSRGMH